MGQRPGHASAPLEHSSAPILGAEAWLKYSTKISKGVIFSNNFGGRGTVIFQFGGKGRDNFLLHFSRVGGKGRNLVNLLMVACEMLPPMSILGT